MSVSKGISYLFWIPSGPGNAELTVLTGLLTKDGRMAHLFCLGFSYTCNTG